MVPTAENAGRPCTCSPRSPISSPRWAANPTSFDADGLKAIEPGGKIIVVPRSRRHHHRAPILENPSPIGGVETWDVKLFVTDGGPFVQQR